MSFDWMILGLRILGTVVLYSFLGVALYTIWYALQQTAKQTIFDSQTSPQLRVLRTPNSQNLVVGDMIALETVTVLGSMPDNRIVLDDALPRHLRLLKENNTWWIEPLAEAEILVDDTPIVTPIRLKNQTVIAFGAYQFRFELT
ncbi:FHA domain-containing protein [Anaerolineales bacterium HSG25]|nr:FHA domain-containing protein [Anaerolineales bacterium HSG25]